MEIKKTALHKTHKKWDAKMVAYAGFEMPIWYSSIIEEHKAVRTGVGVFDVSHMGEFILKGPHAIDLIQHVTSNDAGKLIIGKAQYSCLPNKKRGIVDDLIVYKTGDEEYLLVVNAGNVNKDWDWISHHNTNGVSMQNCSDDICLLAVQGPKAMSVVQQLTSTDLSVIKYYHFTKTTFAGVPDVLISNTGYTGSGGVEIYVQKKNILAIWNALFEAGQSENIMPIGLGARDTLRLEKGYCLYGKDIDDTTSPLEAGLGWITKFTKSFICADELKKQKERGIEKKLVGFKMVEKGIPRHGYEIKNSRKNTIGRVTSGALSPMLNTGIGLGYVAIENADPGTLIFIDIRGKQVQAVVHKLPLV